MDINFSDFNLIWWIIAAEVILLFIFRCKNKIRDYRVLKYQDIEKLAVKIKSMTPRRFEYFCADLYKTLGYKTLVTSATGDGGKDVILDKKIYVECKHYLNNTRVGRPIAVSLYGVCCADKKKGILFTCGKVTIDCRRFCEHVGIEIVDMEGILKLCKYIGTTKILDIAGIEYTDNR